ncbi:hypothetical protein CSUI_002510, partial [Cystoisospora suis]
FETTQETNLGQREAEIRDLRQQVRAAETEAREAQRQAKEETEALSQQLEQAAREYKLKLDDLREALDRQLKQLQTTEAELQHQRKHYEENLGRLTRETEDKIKTLEAEKRRATEEAARATLQLKQEEQRNATEVESLQEQCQNLALQHAKSMAKCEQLAKQAEGVQSDCERRLNEYERLRGDFSSLEETHRGLLVEMEGLNRAKEQAEAAVAELRRQLFTEQEKRDQMRQQIEAVEADAKDADRAKEEAQRQSRAVAAELAHAKKAIAAKLTSAKKKEEKLKSSMRVLLDRTNQVMTERNGLWHTLLKVKDDYGVHAKQIESQAAARLRLPTCWASPINTGNLPSNATAYPAMSQGPTRLPSFEPVGNPGALPSHRVSGCAYASGLPFFEAAANAVSNNSESWGLQGSGPAPGALPPPDAMGPGTAMSAPTGSSAWLPSTLTTSDSAEKHTSAGPLNQDGAQLPAVAGSGFVDGILTGLNFGDSSGSPMLPHSETECLGVPSLFPGYDM